MQKELVHRRDFSAETVESLTAFLERQGCSPDSGKLLIEGNLPPAAAEVAGGDRAGADAVLPTAGKFAFGENKKSKERKLQTPRPVTPVGPLDRMFGAIHKAAAAAATTPPSANGKDGSPMIRVRPGIALGTPRTPQQKQLQRPLAMKPTVKLPCVSASEQQTVPIKRGGHLQEICPAQQLATAPPFSVSRAADRTAAAAAAVAEPTHADGLRNEQQAADPAAPAHFPGLKAAAARPPRKRKAFV